MKNIVRAHTSIALIKYWGKKDADLRLPLMSSISTILDTFYTDTSLLIDTEDKKFILNGQEVAGPAANRVFDYVERLQRLFNVTGNFHVISGNHVPTAIELASSSSAFAALAVSFVKAYDLSISPKGLSILACLGSGSATRSIYGGFVKWNKGANSANLFAEIVSEKPQMDLKLLAVEISEAEKKLSSTRGMKLAQTSPFSKPWIARNDEEIAQMEATIESNDLTKLGQLAELGASEIHAINLAAQPGFTYFANETSEITKLIQELRNKGLRCYYTIDAGPSVKILCQKNSCSNIKKYVKNILPNVKIVEAGFGPGITYLD